MSDREIEYENIDPEIRAKLDMERLVFLQVNRVNYTASLDYVQFARRE